MAYASPYYDDVDEEDGAGGPVPPPPPAPGAPGPTPGAPAPAPTGDEGGPGGGGGGGGQGGGPDLGPQYNWPGLPGFRAPVFNRPTFEQAQQEPGYEFRLGAGQQALERSAAARGTLRSGGTLQGLMEYGQKFGSQEYSNVFNRALQAYDREYQGAKDTYAPLLAQWQTKAQGEIQRALALYGNRNRGGGGGGQYIPPDVLGPPPTPPDYASYSMAPAVAAPQLYAPMDTGGGGGGAFEDDPRYRRY